MATVPGDPTNVTPMMPEWAKPTMADFLQAAQIMHEKGKFPVAGNVLQFPEQDLRRISPEEQAKINTKTTLGRALGRQNVLPITPGGEK